MSILDKMVEETRGSTKEDWTLCAAELDPERRRVDGTTGERQIRGTNQAVRAFYRTRPKRSV